MTIEQLEQSRAKLIHRRNRLQDEENKIEGELLALDSLIRHKKKSENRRIIAFDDVHRFLHTMNRFFLWMERKLNLHFTYANFCQMITNKFRLENKRKQGEFLSEDTILSYFKKIKRGDWELA
ncbi:hypothetical protein [uncultured Bacteroides sp.]|uniref:hypothetical protein n=1 Tax=uncultured Bacteroides sp. TaxID=162156 RepID=UPI003748E5F4